MATHSLACQVNSLHAVASVSLLTNRRSTLGNGTFYSFSSLGDNKLQASRQNERNTANSKENTLSLPPGPNKRGFGTFINKHARASHIQIRTEKSASLRDFTNTFKTSGGKVNKENNNMKHVNHGINLNSTCTAFILLSYSKCSTVLIAERGGGMYSSDLEYYAFWALLNMIMNRMRTSKLGSLIGSFNHPYCHTTSMMHSFTAFLHIRLTERLLQFTHCLCTSDFAVKMPYT